MNILCHCREKKSYDFLDLSNINRLNRVEFHAWLMTAVLLFHCRFKQWKYISWVVKANRSSEWNKISSIKGINISLLLQYVLVYQQKVSAETLLTFIRMKWLLINFQSLVCILHFRSVAKKCHSPSFCMALIILLQDMFYTILSEWVSVLHWNAEWE